MNPFTIRDDVLPFLVEIVNSQDASVIMAVVGKKKNIQNPIFLT